MDHWPDSGATETETFVHPALGTPESAPFRDALSEQRAALRGLAVNGRRASQAFADQHEALADVWRALPAFEAESRRLLYRAERFRRSADSVLTALRPGARALSATVQEAPATAHELKGLTQALGPVSDAAVRGLPAARRFFDDTRSSTTPTAAPSRGRSSDRRTRPP